MALSRRRLLELGGGFAAGAALGGGAAIAGSSTPAGNGNAQQLPFDGPHAQQGITTLRQRHLALASFDLSDDLTGAFGRHELAGLLEDWSGAARRLAAGQAVDAGLSAAGGLGAAADPGSAEGLDAAGLTLTFGFGPGVFAAARRLVAAGDRPVRFTTLPAFPGEGLEERWSGGDLIVAAGADDAQVAVHAVHTLMRIGRGAVRLRWLQRGFVPSAPEGEAPRNLMGFQDGQSMLDHRDAGVANRLLWAGADAPVWMRGGGTFLVVRRIRMLLESWDTATLEHQETTIGRSRGRGDLLPGTAIGGADLEGAPAEPYAADARGSHATVARRAAEATGQILRRPYSYADGVVEATGQLDAGLVFLAYQRSIPDQFVPMQARLARADALNEYTQAIGSAVFAMPPASRSARDWVGRPLLRP